MTKPLDSLAEGPEATRDVRLLLKAIEQGWEIRPEWREAVLMRLARIAMDPEVQPRYALRAIEVMRRIDHMRADIALKELPAKHEVTHRNAAINVYLPENGRQVNRIPASKTNGNGNGKH